MTLPSTSPVQVLISHPYRLPRLQISHDHRRYDRVQVFGWTRLFPARDELCQRMRHNAFANLARPGLPTCRSGHLLVLGPQDPAGSQHCLEKPRYHLQCIGSHRRSEQYSKYKPNRVPLPFALIVPTLVPGRTGRTSLRNPSSSADWRVPTFADTKGLKDTASSRSIGLTRSGLGLCVRQTTSPRPMIIKRAATGRGYRFSPYAELDRALTPPKRFDRSIGSASSKCGGRRQALRCSIRGSAS